MNKSWNAVASIPRGAGSPSGVIRHMKGDGLFVIGAIVRSWCDWSDPRHMARVWAKRGREWTGNMRNSEWTVCFIGLVCLDQDLVTHGSREQAPVAKKCEIGVCVCVWMEWSTEEFSSLAYLKGKSTLNDIHINLCDLQRLNLKENVCSIFTCVCTVV